MGLASIFIAVAVVTAVFPSFPAVYAVAVAAVLLIAGSRYVSYLALRSTLIIDALLEKRREGGR